MFTIKHIDEQGAEHLWNATDPSFANGVFTSRQDGECLWVKGGSVYVMNDKGSTVASYKLAPSAGEAFNAAIQWGQLSPQEIERQRELQQKAMREARASVQSDSNFARSAMQDDGFYQANLSQKN